MSTGWPIFCAYAFILTQLALLLLALPVAAHQDLERAEPGFDTVLDVPPIIGSLWFATNCMLLFWQSASSSQRSVVEAIGNGVPMSLLQSRLRIIWSVRQINAAGPLLLYRQGPVGRLKIKIILVAILLAIISMTSHGVANVLWPSLTAPLDWSQLLVGAAWLGGLVTLALIVIPIRRGSGNQMGELFAVVSRFPKVAVIAVTISAATGVCATMLHFLEPVDILALVMAESCF